MVDGMILMVPTITNKVHEIIKNYNTEVVIVTDDESYSEYDTVGLDNFQGAYSIVQYLIETLGHEKIAMIKRS